MSATTMQRVSLESKDGKRFLRRVIRENEALSWGETWAVDASVGNDWCLRFYRTVKGDVGTPDQEVEVQTDFAVRLPPEQHCGRDVQPFSDAKAVYVPSPRRLWLTGSYVSTMADHVCKGGTVHIEASAGSTSSAEHGLAFLSLDLVTRSKSGRISTVTLGQTVCKDGRTICSGPVDVS